MASALNRIPGLTDLLGRWLSGRAGVSHTDASDTDVSDTDAVEDEDTVETGTTTGGGSDQEPVVVWTAANPLEARIVKGRLESEGIPAAIQGEAMGEILGLAAGSLASTDVLVPKPLVDQAVALLEREQPLDDSIDGDE